MIHLGEKRLFWKRICKGLDCAALSITVFMCTYVTVSVFVTRVGDLENLTSPGRFLLENTNFSIMCKCNWIPNQLLTRIRRLKAADRENSGVNEREIITQTHMTHTCFLIFEISLPKVQLKLKLNQSGL